MPDRLAAYDPPTRAGPPFRYDWDTLFDGSTWRLYAGKDFKGSVSNFKDYIYKRARLRNVKVSAWSEDKAVVIRAVIAKPRKKRA